jgi:hypothetical protein
MGFESLINFRLASEEGALVNEEGAVGAPDHTPAYVRRMPRDVHHGLLGFVNE